jgi:hypothetical protein
MLEDVYKETYKMEYLILLEYENSDKASRLANIYAVKNTVRIWKYKLEARRK